MRPSFTCRLQQLPLTPIAAALLLALAMPVHADKPKSGASTASDADQPVEVIEVQGVRQRLERKGQLGDMIEKTELISSAELFNSQSATLSEAIDTAPGIRVSNECSMCGIKRVMINGLKGEHTTILVDGVPMHSMVSSYYGMDAISTAGIDSIEIARGSGASMIAPEAIGGTINIITKTPYRNAVEADLSTGTDGYRNASVMGTAVTKDGKGGALVTAQSYTADGFDGDGNGVGETAAMDNQSLSVKLTYDFSPRDNAELRYARFTSDIMGGPFGVSRDAALSSLINGDTPFGQWFEDGDVSQRYLAQPWETTEAIDSKREELTLRWLRELADDWSLTTTGSTVDHGQDSFYEGFDYRNQDRIYYGDLRLSWSGLDNHLITFGVDGRNEEMRSQSDALVRMQQDDPSLTGDSFDYQTWGAYVQDTWTINDALELQVALRFDHITADFVDQTEVGDELSETLLSPRAHLRYLHNQQWTSRLSAGYGYRAPLAFFESDHGILEDGFQIAIDELEESRSVNYALSFEGEALVATASAAYTEIDHLAWIETEGVERPTLLNLDQKVSVATYDLMASYQLTDWLSVDGGIEHFDYSKAYQGTFSVAPLEQRVTAGFDAEWQGWDLVASASWIGSRDLSKYGYGDRYNRFVDANNNGLVEVGELQDPKSTDAPSFVTVDLKLSKALDDVWQLYAGVNNLFDYNQAADGESPLYWADADGEAAYDVAHIWGPLYGRQVYAGLKATF
ncbi:MAG: TonB-dependent receptor [Gammaproteobacteria bacterium]|nr:TonB-dependent receptor [Gammaproteobacteria bacterium]